MNELFENEYKMETKLYKEYVYNVLCKKTIISGVIILILGIFMFFVMDQDKSYVMLTAGIIAGVASIMTPILTVKQLEETEAMRLQNAFADGVRGLQVCGVKTLREEAVVKCTRA